MLEVAKVRLESARNLLHCHSLSLSRYETFLVGLMALATVGARLCGRDRRA